MTQHLNTLYMRVDFQIQKKFKEDYCQRNQPQASLRSLTIPSNKYFNQPV